MANGKVEIDVRYGNPNDSRDIYGQTFHSLVERLFVGVVGMWPLLNTKIKIVKGGKL